MLEQLEKPAARDQSGHEPEAAAISRWEGQERERAVQRMFTAIARRYDLNNTLLSFGLHHAWKRRAAALIPRLPGGPILDLGAGTADLSLLLPARLGHARPVVAADLNHPMLREGLRKIRAQRLEGAITCLQGNAQKLGFHDESFETVISGFCMRNLGNLEDALLEIRRVLRGGGTFICLEFSRPSNPVLRRLYDMYSFTLLPWIGTRVAHDDTGVYQYLPASIRTFPDQARLCQRLLEAGFREVTYENLTGGIVAIHVAKK